MTARDVKECPWCGEWVRRQAIICRFCKNDVTERGIRQATAFIAGAGAAPGALAKESAAPGGAGGLNAALPANILDQIIAAGETVDEGERRPITILFSDLSDYTNLTHSIGAERMTEILDLIYAEIRAIIDAYGGKVEKFIGDAVMAIFGAPKSHGDDPARAIRAALDVHQSIRRIGEEEQVALSAHSGIAFGEVVFTVKGDDRSVDFRTIGDAVNLAARLQSAAPKGHIYVSQRTYQQTRTEFNWEELQPLFVKGEKQPVIAFQVLGPQKKFSKANLGERIAMAPLVGRDAELKLLSSTANQVAKGRAKLVWIEGDSGVGKSRLIYEFHQRLLGKKTTAKDADVDVRATGGQSATQKKQRRSAAPTAGWHWFTGRCLSYGMNTAYLPFKQLIRSAFRALQEPQRPRDDPPEAEDAETAISIDELKQLIQRIYSPALREQRSANSKREIKKQIEETVDVLGLLLALNPEKSALTDLAPDERKKRLYRAILDLLIQLGGQKPTALIFEDFQWADGESVQLLDYLLTRLQPHPILTIIVARPETARPKLPAADCLRISLAELSKENSELLLRRLLGIENFPAELSARIIEKTEGNPFFLEEVILDLADKGFLKRHENAYLPTRPIAAIEIPDTVEGVALARLDRLERKVKMALQCAAVIGQEFRYNVLRQVSEVGERLRGYLFSLVQGDYVLPQTLIPEMIYIFRHVVLREVTYGTLLHKRRREYHRRAAEAIEILFAERLDEYVELLGHHYERAERYDQAARYYERAALKAEMLYSNYAAADCWERAELCLQREAPGPGRDGKQERKVSRLRAKLHLGEIYRIIGQPQKGVQTYETARSISRDLKDAAAEATALLGLAEAQRLSGDLEHGLKCLNAARRRLRTLKDGRLGAVCENLQGHFERFQGNYRRAGAHFRRVLEYAEQAGDLKLRYQALNHLGIIQLYGGDLEQADSRFVEAQQLALELGRREEWVQIELNRGLAALKRGACDQAGKFLAQAQAQAEKLDYELGAQLVMLARTDLCLKQGDFRQALQLSRQLRKRCNEARYAQIAAIALSNYARAQAALKQYDLAAISLDEARTIAEADGNYVALIDIMSVNSELLLANGELQQALNLARKALSQVRRHRENEHLSAAQLLVARAYRALGQNRKSLDFARAALKTAIASKVPRDQAWAKWAIGRCRSDEQQFNNARTAFEESLNLAEMVGDKALARKLQQELHALPIN